MKKQNCNIKRTPVIYLIILMAFPGFIQAQSIKRQCVSSYGSTEITDNVRIEQTAGQSFNTVTETETKSVVFQGFQQPVVFKTEKTDSEGLKTIDLEMYPNPAEYSVTIETGELIKDSDIRVSDIYGKLIFEAEVHDLQTYILECTGWSNGTYLITVSDNNQRESSYKLLISK